MKLNDLYLATIAHTDAGDFLQIDDELKKEFVLQGTITKARAGLFFIEIDGDKFTAHKQDGFSIGDQVNCIVNFHLKDNERIFSIRSLEKIS
jgi:ribosomal protein S1